MFRLKVLISVVVFSSLLILTSAIKNQTRLIEKKIFNLVEVISLMERDFNETQLDYYYLSSPSMIEKKIDHLGNNIYLPMDHSKIFLSISDFIEIEKRLVNQKNQYEKKTKKN